MSNLKLKLEIPKKLAPFLTKKKRFKIAYGGRGGAKSQTFAGILLMQAQTEGIKVGCFREYQNSIEDSVHALLSGEIGRLNIPGYNINKTYIDNDSGGGFRFKGLSRSPDTVKSMFGFKKFWLEEAQSVSQQSLRLLTPTLREADSEAWFSLNLMSSADPISQKFIEPFKAELDQHGYYEDDLHLIVKVNYYDNPWFPKTLDLERLHDLKTLTRAEYDHIWLGAYNDSVEGAIIPAEWFDAAVDAHINLGFKPQGVKVVSFDPSDEGADDKALVVRHGSVITAAETMTTGDSADGMRWAITRAIEERANLFVWDCDGLGVALKFLVTEGLDHKGIDYAMYKGSESPFMPDALYDGESSGGKDQRKKNKEVFRNRRAQYYWALRDRFFNTYRAVVKKEYVNPDKMISISSDIKALNAMKSEVCRVPRKYNSNGLIQIMSKQDMKRIKIKSPNMSDACKMSLFVPRDILSTGLTAADARQMYEQYARPRC